MSLPFVTLTSVWPGLGQAVGRLGVRQRAHLAERVEVAAGHARRARPRRGSRAGRCARWPARRPTRCGRADRGRGRARARPRAPPRRPVPGIILPPAARRGPSTTMSAPRALEGLGLPGAVHADHQAEVAGATGLDADQRVLEHDRLGGFDAQRPGAGQEGVGRGLARQAVALGDEAVDDALRRGRGSRRRRRIVARVGARGHDGACEAPARGRRARSAASRRRPRRRRPRSGAARAPSCGRRARGRGSSSDSIPRASRKPRTPS